MIQVRWIEIISNLDPGPVSVPKRMTSPAQASIRWVTCYDAMTGESLLPLNFTNDGKIQAHVPG